jgi:histone H2A
MVKQTNTMGLDAQATKSDDAKTIASRSAKSGLIWPVSRMHRRLTQSKTTKRISAGAPVYVSAVMERFARELLSTASDLCIKNGRKRLTTSDIIAALRSDSELDKATSGLKVLVGSQIKGRAAADAIRSKNDQRKRQKSV